MEQRHASMVSAEVVHPTDRIVRVPLAQEIAWNPARQRSGLLWALSTQETAVAASIAIRRMIQTVRNCAPDAG